MRILSTSLSSRVASKTAITVATTLLLLTTCANSADTKAADTGVSTSEVPTELISNTRADTSVLLEAVARGEDPEFELLRTRFFCYYQIDEKEQFENDFSKPHGTADFKENSYSFTSNVFPDQAGKLEDDGDRTNSVYFTPTNGDRYRMSVSHDIFGQRLELKRNKVLVGCFQKGASHERALHQFLLNTPETGEFNCRVGLNDKIVARNMPLTLLEGGRYSFDNSGGTYLYSAINKETFGQIGFATGPLANWEGQYSENPNSGEQHISVASPDEKAGTLCDRQRPARPFKRFGETVVSPPSASSTPLNGTYYLNNGDIATVGWAVFTEDGFMNTDRVLPGVTNCRRTLPNGLEPCIQYVYNGGGTINFKRGAQQMEAPMRRNTNGVLEIAGLPGRYEPIRTPTTAELVGQWTISSTTPQDNIDLSLCIIGYCSTSTSSLTYEFSADGRFADSSSSSGIFTANSPGFNAFSSQSSTSGQQGKYSFNGAALQIQYDSGVLKSNFAHLYDADTLIIGFRVFRRDK